MGVFLPNVTFTSPKIWTLCFYQENPIKINKLLKKGGNCCSALFPPCLFCNHFLFVDTFHKNLSPELNTKRANTMGKYSCVTLQRMIRGVWWVCAEINLCMYNIFLVFNFNLSWTATQFIHCYCLFKKKVDRSSWATIVTIPMILEIICPFTQTLYFPKFTHFSILERLAFETKVYLMRHLCIRNSIPGDPPCLLGHKGCQETEGLWKLSLMPFNIVFL